MKPALCSRCKKNPRRKPEIPSWCVPCHAETERARRRAKNGIRPGFCRCGAKLDGRERMYACSDCLSVAAKSRVSPAPFPPPFASPPEVNDGRMRCQVRVRGEDCRLPAVPGKRWCRAHEPRFFTGDSLEQYATARREVVT